MVVQHQPPEVLHRVGERVLGHDEGGRLLVALGERRVRRDRSGETGQERRVRRDGSGETGQDHHGGETGQERQVITTMEERQVKTTMEEKQVKATMKERQVRTTMEERQDNDGVMIEMIVME